MPPSLCGKGVRYGDLSEFRDKSTDLHRSAPKRSASVSEKEAWSEDNTSFNTRLNSSRLGDAPCSDIC